MLTTLLAGALVAVALVPPNLPRYEAFAASASGAPAAAMSPRRQHQRLTARARLLRALQREGHPRGVRPSLLPLRPQLPPRATGDSLLIGFYVNWDDNALVSLQAHASSMDWVVAEWAFIAPGGDSLRFAVDPRALYVVQGLPVAERPRVLLMVSNVREGAGRFDPRDASRLLADSLRRVAAARSVAATVRRFGLAGATIDFESLADADLPNVERFLREVRAALGPGLLLTHAIGSDVAVSWVARFAAVTDREILMLYDEHYGTGEAGPIASRDWYAGQLRRLARVVPPAKLIAAVGAYGYDWSDAPGAAGTALTIEEVWAAARTHGRRPLRDARSGNPYLLWTDPDSTDHVAWFLDAVTAAEQVRIARAAGVTAHAIWRLGAEDPSLWRVLGRHGHAAPLAALDVIDPGYGVEFAGSGELLSISAEPHAGHRTLRFARDGTLQGDVIDTLPTPWVVARTGAIPHRVALTFDDGPDDQWTPAILDTLASRGAPAAFFVVGRQVEAHPALTRRILAAGHEIGNHTFTHPNLALTSPWVTRLEIDASARLLEGVLARRTILFRPPYFGDAEPTTADELVPLQIATGLGYLSIGTRVDGEDWRNPGVDAIIANVMTARARGNVVLLHDGGGNRAQTVAALGPLIDSLRAAGDTLVSLGALAGLAPDVVMPRIPPGGRWTRWLEVAVFGGLAAVQWGWRAVLVAVVILGTARLLLVFGLALVQRRRAHGAAVPPPPQALVSVIVPAYREEKVIVRTIDSLLGQRGVPSLEVIVIDDGSPDNTFAVADAAFRDDPRVRVLRQANGGKASALNHGLAEARGEWIVALDADTQFEPETIAHLVAPLADPRVGAVAGNAKVGNRINLVTRWQAVEYVTSQNLDRRAFSLLGCITVVPGAVGAWRRDAVRAAGGFSTTTLAEDQDLTLQLSRQGYRIAYADDAVAWTEAPDTLRALATQRFRWAYGTLQCAWKHRDLLFRPGAGTLGWIGLPNVWLFQVVFSLLGPLADLGFVLSLLELLVTRAEHGNTYALVELQHVATWYAAFLAVDWLATVAAFWMEPKEDRGLAWLVFLQRFAYRQVMYWVVVRSVVAAIRGGPVGWGQLERKATVRVAPT